ncbi:MAG: phosphonate C-P lyase system protein PhnH [Betaproteobacteria bacterium]|nr:phosphonate C-P lyase system protein PhnH [Betaproteobacteria bacterium]
MSLAMDLASVGPGLQAPELESQKIFRAAAEALAHPGRIVAMQTTASMPAGLHEASGALALSLLDHDTPLWLSPRLAGAASFLRFHTGCPLTERAERAAFAILEAGALRSLADFDNGEDAYPERSATLIVQVERLDDQGGWTLAGPGIKDRAQLRVEGLPAQFAAEWAANAGRFPRGVDLFLSCGGRACGLPRTTRIEA